jgi:peptidylprolyl isomerase
LKIAHEKLRAERQNHSSFSLESVGVKRGNLSLVKPPVIVGLVVVIVAVIALVLSQQPQQPAANVSLCDALPAFQPIDPATITALKTEDLSVGTGAEAQAGKNVAMHYIGYLPNGTKFDSSCDRGQPFGVAVGQGQVIRGWDEGIPGMKVGGKRRLLIPSNLAYGERGIGPIPPNTPLVFDVELVAVQ